MRLELIDKAVSTRVRPGRIVQTLGRRILIRLHKEDNDSEVFEIEDDLQVFSILYVSLISR